MKRLIPLLFILLATAAYAQKGQGSEWNANAIQETQSIEEQLTLKINSSDGRYAIGDTLKVWACVDIAPRDSLTLCLWKGALEDKQSERKVLLAKGETLLLEKVFDSPTAEFMSISSSRDPKDFTRVGWIAAEEGFTPGFSEPRDLMRFWRRQIRAMRKDPMVPILTPVELKGADAEKFDAYGLEINCTGPAPVRGYLVVPKGAAAKSLPIAIYVHGAGVKGNWCRSDIRSALNMAKSGSGAIGIDINAHGMLNDQPQSYYDALDEGELAKYSARPVTDHESFYFRTMMLRLVRTIDYATTLKEWDGKRVMMYGSSQGGYQSAVLASIDKRVSHAVLLVPAGIDIGGTLAGRKGGWPNCLERDGLDSPAVKICPYYDAALLLRHCKADIYAEIGLIDTTCPAANIFAGLNGVRGDKEIHTYPFRPHHYPSDKYSEGYKSIDKARNNWIKERLK